MRLARNRTVQTAAILAAVVCLSAFRFSLFAFRPAQHGAELAGRVREWAVPLEDAQPSGVAVDARGRIWVALERAGKLARFEPKSGEWQPFAPPTPDSGPRGIIAALDGSLWYAAARAGKIGRVDAATGKITEYAVPGGAAAHSLALARDATLWFTAPEANRIFAMDTKKASFEEFSLPTENAQPEGIAITPDGLVWFAEAGANRLAWLDPRTGRIREVGTPFAAAHPRQLLAVEYPVRAIYYTDSARGSLGRLEVARMSFKEWTSPSGAASQPDAIAADGDGYIWYTELRANQLVRFDPQKQTFRRFTLPSPDSAARAMTADAGGRLWLALSGANKIAMVD